MVGLRSQGGGRSPISDIAFPTRRWVMFSSARALARQHSASLRRAGATSFGHIEVPAGITPYPLAAFFFDCFYQEEPARSAGSAVSCRWQQGSLFPATWWTAPPLRGLALALCKSGPPSCKPDDNSYETGFQDIATFGRTIRMANEPQLPGFETVSTV